MFTLSSQYSHLLQIPSKNTPHASVLSSFLQKLAAFSATTLNTPPKKKTPTDRPLNYSLPVADFCACLYLHLYPIAYNAVAGLFGAYAEHFYLRALADRYDRLACRAAA